ncbi:MAG: hypothetical protein ACK44W_13590 [Planctomycetota bacterium]
MIEALARILRQKRAVLSLLPELTAEIVKIVPADWLRYDLEDQGKLWSRAVRPGREPERPGLGAVPRLSSRETEYAKPIEGGFEACVLLGIGEPSGRLVLRRASGPFGDDDMARLRQIADVLSLGLRARPFEPPPKPRSPFEEGPLV